eukprot:TRINITY_DN1318_c0_g1_i1.p1 TRINITY_DN1318_c0_g1~~TRINITY_DN1318_c0_g1_i1.p1  ORF type:complete len:3143 (+),score=462.00 TRINITY_DN1318_c0_g1_i1:695-9430(+)
MSCDSVSDQDDCRTEWQRALGQCWGASQAHAAAVESACGQRFACGAHSTATDTPEADALQHPVVKSYIRQTGAMHKHYGLSERSRRVYARVGRQRIVVGSDSDSCDCDLPVSPMRLEPFDQRRADLDVLKKLRLQAERSNLQCGSVEVSVADSDEESLDCVLDEEEEDYLTEREIAGQRSTVANLLVGKWDPPSPRDLLECHDDPDGWIPQPPPNQTDEIQCKQDLISYMHVNRRSATWSDRMSHYARIRFGEAVMEGAGRRLAPRCRVEVQGLAEIDTEGCPLSNHVFEEGVLFTSTTGHTYQLSLRPHIDSDIAPGLPVRTTRWCYRLLLECVTEGTPLSMEVAEIQWQIPPEERRLDGRVIELVVRCGLAWQPRATCFPDARDSAVGKEGRHQARSRDDYQTMSATFPERVYQEPDEVIGLARADLTQAVNVTGVSREECVRRHVSDPIDVMRWVRVYTTCPDACASMRIRSHNFDDPSVKVLVYEEPARNKLKFKHQHFRRLLYVYERLIGPAPGAGRRGTGGALLPCPADAPKDGCWLTVVAKDGVCLYRSRRLCDRIVDGSEEAVRTGSPLKNGQTIFAHKIVGGWAVTQRGYYIPMCITGYGPKLLKLSPEGTWRSSGPVHRTLVLSRDEFLEHSASSIVRLQHGVTQSGDERLVFVRTPSYTSIRHGPCAKCGQAEAIAAEWREPSGIEPANVLAGTTVRRVQPACACSGAPVMPCATTCIRDGMELVGCGPWRLCKPKDVENVNARTEAVGTLLPVRVIDHMAPHTPQHIIVSRQENGDVFVMDAAGGRRGMFTAIADEDSRCVRCADGSVFHAMWAADLCESMSEVCALVAAQGPDELWSGRLYAAIDADDIMRFAWAPLTGDYVPPPGSDAHTRPSRLSRPSTVRCAVRCDDGVYVGWMEQVGSGGSELHELRVVMPRPDLCDSAARVACTGDVHVGGGGSSCKADITFEKVRDGVVVSVSTAAFTLSGTMRAEEYAISGRVADTGTDSSLRFVLTGRGVPTSGLRCAVQKTGGEWVLGTVVETGSVALDEVLFERQHVLDVNSEYCLLRYERHTESQFGYHRALALLPEEHYHSQESPPPLITVPAVGVRVPTSQPSDSHWKRDTCKVHPSSVLREGEVVHVVGGDSAGIVSGFNSDSVILQMCNGDSSAHPLQDLAREYTFTGHFHNCLVTQPGQRHRGGAGHLKLRWMQKYDEAGQPVAPSCAGLWISGTGEQECTLHGLGNGSVVFGTSRHVFYGAVGEGTISGSHHRCGADGVLLPGGGSFNVAAATTRVWRDGLQPSASPTPAEVNKWPAPTVPPNKAVRLDVRRGDLAGTDGVTVGGPNEGGTPWVKVQLPSSQVVRTVLGSLAFVEASFPQPPAVLISADDVLAEESRCVEAGLVSPTRPGVSKRIHRADWEFTEHEGGVVEREYWDQDRLADTETEWSDVDASDTGESQSENEELDTVGHLIQERRSWIDTHDDIRGRAFEDSEVVQKLAALNKAVRHAWINLPGAPVADYAELGKPDARRTQWAASMDVAGVELCQTLGEDVAGLRDLWSHTGFDPAAHLGVGAGLHAMYWCAAQGANEASGGDMLRCAAESGAIGADEAAAAAVARSVVARAAGQVAAELKRCEGRRTVHRRMQLSTEEVEDVLAEASGHEASRAVLWTAAVLRSAFGPLTITRVHWGLPHTSDNDAELVVALRERVADGRLVLTGAEVVELHRASQRTDPAELTVWCNWGDGDDVAVFAAEGERLVVANGSVCEQVAAFMLQLADPPHTEPPLVNTGLQRLCAAALKMWEYQTSHQTLTAPLHVLEQDTWVLGRSYEAVCSAESDFSRALANCGVSLQDGSLNVKLSSNGNIPEGWRVWAVDVECGRTVVRTRQQADRVYSHVRRAAAAATIVFRGPRSCTTPVTELVGAVQPKLTETAVRRHLGCVAGSWDERVLGQLSLMLNKPQLRLLRVLYEVHRQAAAHGVVVPGMQTPEEAIRASAGLSEDEACVWPEWMVVSLQLDAGFPSASAKGQTDSDLALWWRRQEVKHEEAASRMEETLLQCALDARDHTEAEWLSRHAAGHSRDRVSAAVLETAEMYADDGSVYALFKSMSARGDAAAAGLKAAFWELLAIRTGGGRRLEPVGTPEGAAVTRNMLPFEAAMRLLERSESDRSDLAGACSRSPAQTTLPAAAAHHASLQDRLIGAAADCREAAGTAAEIDGEYEWSPSDVVQCGRCDTVLYGWQHRRTGCRCGGALRRVVCDFRVSGGRLQRALPACVVDAREAAAEDCGEEPGRVVAEVDAALWPVDSAAAGALPMQDGQTWAADFAATATPQPGGRVLRVYVRIVTHAVLKVLEVWSDRSSEAVEYAVLRKGSPSGVGSTCDRGPRQPSKPWWVCAREAKVKRFIMLDEYDLVRHTSCPPVPMMNPPVPSHRSCAAEVPVCRSDSVWRCSVSEVVRLRGMRRDRMCAQHSRECAAGQEQMWLKSALWWQLRYRHNEGVVPAVREALMKRHLFGAQLDDGDEELLEWAAKDFDRLPVCRCTDQEVLQWHKPQNGAQGDPCWSAEVDVQCSMWGLAQGMRSMDGIRAMSRHPHHDLPGLSADYFTPFRRGQDHIPVVRKVRGYRRGPHLPHSGNLRGRDVGLIGGSTAVCAEGFFRRGLKKSSGWLTWRGVPVPGDIGIHPKWTFERIDFLFRGVRGLSTINGLHIAALAACVAAAASTPALSERLSSRSSWSLERYHLGWNGDAADMMEYVHCHWPDCVRHPAPGLQMCSFMPVVGQTVYLSMEFPKAVWYRLAVGCSVGQLATLSCSEVDEVRCKSVSLYGEVEVAGTPCTVVSVPGRGSGAVATVEVDTERLMKVRDEAQQIPPAVRTMLSPGRQPALAVQRDGYLYRRVDKGAQVVARTFDVYVGDYALFPLCADVLTSKEM